MPYKKRELVCAECLHAFMGRKKQRFCSKVCAAESPEGSTIRAMNMTKLNLALGKKIDDTYYQEVKHLYERYRSNSR